MLDDVVEAMRGRTHVIAVLSDAGGVRRGTPVWIAGKPAGRVESVEFLPRRPYGPPRVTVTLEIVGRDVDQIGSSSSIRVTSESLVGGPVIDVLPAPATSRRLSIGDTLYGRRAGSTEAVRAELDSLKAGLDSLAGEAASLTEPAQRFVRRANQIQRNLAAVGAELAAVEQLLRPSADGGAGIDSAFLDRVDRLLETAQALGAAFRQARSRYGRASAELGEPIARIQRRADALSARIAAFRSLTEAPAAPGMPARIRADSAIFSAIRGVRAQLDSLIAEVRRDPFGYAF